MKKVAIVIRVGRRNFRNVVTDLLRSLNKYGHFDRSIFNLYLSVDRTYENLSSSDLDLPSEQVNRFFSVRYISEDDRKDMVRWLFRSRQISFRVAETILLRKPYSFQLNSALIAALR